MRGRKRALGLIAVTALAATPAWGAGLSDSQVRAFVAEQQRSWNAGSLDAS